MSKDTFKELLNCRNQDDLSALNACFKDLRDDEDAFGTDRCDNAQTILDTALDCDVSGTCSDAIKNLCNEIVENLNSDQCSLSCSSSNALLIGVLVGGGVLVLGATIFYTRRHKKNELSSEVAP